MEFLRPIPVLSIFPMLGFLNNCVFPQLHKSLSKEKDIRCGDWREYPLSQQQKQYAALDAYVSIVRTLNSLLVVYLCCNKGLRAVLSFRIHCIGMIDVFATECYSMTDIPCLIHCGLTHWGWDKMAAVLQTTFSNAFNIWVSIKVSLKFVPKGPINNTPALVQIMAWCRPGDKPLSEPMMNILLTHICVTRLQWVKSLRPEQNGHHFADNIFKCIFLNENYCTLV